MVELAGPADAGGAGWQGAPPFWLRLGYLAYQIVLHLGAPALLGLALARSLREPLYRAHLGHRFGGAPRAPEGSIWVFAASLGETRAVSPLVRLLLARGETVLLTHASPAGLAEGRRLFADDITSGRLVQGYGPLDLFWTVRRFLSRQRPRAGLIVESEIWPAQLFEARRAGVPMVIVNGAYTERAAQRDRRGAGRLRGGLFPGFSMALTKSEAHAARYRAAGLPAAAVRNPGELRFDLPMNRAQIAAAGPVAAELREGGARVLTLASSVEGEEAALLAMVRSLQQRMQPAPRVVWVPRSPQRFAPVLGALRAAGVKAEARSALFDEHLALRPGAESRLRAAAVLVGDSIGEMDFYYALADAVFVGATLVDHGGHNIIEPLAQERPVLTGPSTYGIAFPAREAADAGALRILPDAAALEAEIAALFSDPARLGAFSACARGFNAGHSGAAARSLAALEPFLER